MRTLGLTLAAGILVVAAAAARQAPTHELWEYRTVWNVTDTAKLNVLGREGWELVSVHTAIFQGTTAREVGWVYFKRRLPAP